MPKGMELMEHQRIDANEQTPRRVLFVCTGNTCRSPMAAALLNHTAQMKEISSLTASSAGLFAAEGAPISPNAAAALTESGVSPELFCTHSARTVSAEMLDEADVVIGMTSRHAMDLILRFPEHAAKIEALPLDIDDPFGGDKEVYRSCLSALSFAIAMRFFGEDEA